MSQNRLILDQTPSEQASQPPAGSEPYTSASVMLARQDAASSDPLKQQAFIKRLQMVLVVLAVLLIAVPMILNLPAVAAVLPFVIPTLFLATPWLVGTASIFFIPQIAHGINTIKNALTKIIDKLSQPSNQGPVPQSMFGRSSHQGDSTSSNDSDSPALMASL